MKELFGKVKFIWILEVKKIFVQILNLMFCYFNQQTNLDESEDIVEERKEESWHVSVFVASSLWT